MVAKVETIGYGYLFKEVARTLALLVHHYAPMRFKSQLYDIVIRIDAFANSLDIAGEAIELERESLGGSFDLQGAARWVNKAVNCVVACLKAHETQLLLNAIFSIIAGQLWSTNSANHMNDTLKIFFTNLAAAEFINFGLKRIDDIKIKFHEFFVSLFEPFEKFDEDLTEKYAHGNVENLMAF